MVLLNFRIKGVQSVGINTTVTNPFRCGRYKVRVVSSNCYFNNDPGYIGFWRVDSKELMNVKRTNGGYGFYLLPQSFANLTLDKNSYCDGYEWEVYLSSPTITINVIPANKAPNETNNNYTGWFQTFVLVLDFEEIV